MTSEQAAGNVVGAVVVYDGRLLLVDAESGWGLPSGTPEPAESETATAARLVYELTGYLVDGSTLLRPTDTAPTAAAPTDMASASTASTGTASTDTAPPDTRSFVVCQLLSETPSADARLVPERLRWSPFAEAIAAGLPAPVRVYLEGHTPV
ncbi:NUDIX domain-containing protein [Streptomyces sp. NPDC054770]